MTIHVRVHVTCTDEDPFSMEMAITSKLSEWVESNYDARYLHCHNHSRN